LKDNIEKYEAAFGKINQSGGSATVPISFGTPWRGLINIDFLSLLHYLTIPLAVQNLTVYRKTKYILYIYL